MNIHESASGRRISFARAAARFRGMLGCVAGIAMRVPLRQNSASWRQRDAGDGTFSAPGGGLTREELD